MIHDKFTTIRHTMSRQQLWQIRRNAKGNVLANFRYQRRKLGIPMDWPKWKRFNQ